MNEALTSAASVSVPTPSPASAPTPALAPAPTPAPAQSGLLSLVATPIGNLGDLSPRARDTLSAADCIVCEDTRVTRKLLNHFGITQRLVRGDENVLAQKAHTFVEELARGAHIAFVSDAGMPGVSDPGQVLCDACLDAGIRVEVIPGASASVAALAASGFVAEHFFFEGFLPRRASEKRARLQLLSHIPATLIIYESPHRVEDTLSHIAEVFADARVALIRELTKIHETCLRGTATSLISMISARADVSLKGECVIVIECAPARAKEIEDQLLAQASSPLVPLETAIAEGLAAGTPKSQLARELARSYKLSKSEIYNKLVGF